jgi:hypothetical protein
MDRLTDEEIDQNAAAYAEAMKAKRDGRKVLVASRAKDGTQSYVDKSPDWAAGHVRVYSLNPEPAEVFMARDNVGELSSVAFDCLSSAREGFSLVLDGGGHLVRFVEDLDWKQPE